MDAANEFAKIMAFAPMVLPMLGLPKVKSDLIISALTQPDMMIDNQPNVALLLKLKNDLEAIDATSNAIKARLVCGKCQYCNTFELRG